jgi:hypothetical protein
MERMQVRLGVQFCMNTRCFMVVVMMVIGCGHHQTNGLDGIFIICVSMRVVLTNSYAQNMKLSIINSSCFNMHYILIDYHLFFNHEKLAAAVLLVDFLPISDGGVSSFSLYRMSKLM